MGYDEKVFLTQVTPLVPLGVRVRRIFHFVSIVCFAGTAARADSFQAFNLNETLTGNGVATGTLTLDTTTGVFTALNVAVSVSNAFPLTPPHFVFTGITRQQIDFGASFGSSVNVGFVDSVQSDPGIPSEQYDLELVFPVSSFVGYGGSALCAAPMPCGVFGFSELTLTGPITGLVPTGFEVLSGAVTPAVAVTPEPSGLWLFGTGLFGVGLMMRKRLGLA